VRKRLYVLVEGPDDERFFKRILINKIARGQVDVKIICYSRWNREKRRKFLKTLRNMGADFVLVTDIDNSPCVTAKKQKVKNEWKEISHDRIVVVVKEIEAWYLAGLDEKASKELKIKQLRTTDDVTKEKFNQIIPRRFKESRIDFMIEILRRFNCKIAVHKSRSFKYLVSKFIICKDK